MIGKDQKGFTLIELLIVIAIIGILATIVILNVSNSRNKAEVAKAQSDIATIKRAMDIHKAINGPIDIYDSSKSMTDIIESLNDGSGDQLIPNPPETLVHYEEQLLSEGGSIEEEFSNGNVRLDCDVYDCSDGIYIATGYKRNVGITDHYLMRCVKLVKNSNVLYDDCLEVKYK